MFPELTRDDVFRIETNRLWLRWACINDAEAIQRMMSVKHVAEMTATWPYPLLDGEVERRIFEMRKFNSLGNGLQLVMTLKGEPDEVIGLVGGSFNLAQTFNIGYALDADYHGQGYATESVQALMDAVFTLSDASQTTAHVRIFNESSCRVLVKSGFTQEGSGIQDMPARGGKTLSDKYVLTRSRWNTLKGWKEPVVEALVIDIGINALDAGVLAEQRLTTNNMHL